MLNINHILICQWRNYLSTECVPHIATVRLFRWNGSRWNRSKVKPKTSGRFYFEDDRYFQLSLLLNPVDQWLPGKNSIKQTIQGEVWPMLDTTTQQHCGYVITALIKTLQAKIHPSLCTIKVAHGNKSNWMILPHSRSDNCFVDLLVHADNSLVFKQK